MPFDPNKLGEEADRMIAELNQPAGAEDQSAASAAEAIAPEQPATATPPEQGVSDDQGANPQIDAQLAELKKQAETADQRWRVLQGMIDKKDSEIESLRVLLAQLSTAQQQAPAPEQARPSGVTQADIQEYGTDLIDLIGRKAAEIVEGRLAPFLEQISSLKGSIGEVAQTSVRSAQHQFEATMNTVVPDWRQLNNDPAFLAWLNQTAPFTTETKLDLLRKAAQALDAEKAAEFFNAYKKEQPPPEQPAAAPSPAKHVAPGRSQAPASRVDNASGKRMWTRPEIAKLYDDKMAGKISQAEFDKLEADIFKAQRENRIAA
jgi:hypothetical protein